MGTSTKWRIEVRTKNSLPPNIFGTPYFASNSNPANMATVPVLLTVVLTTVWYCSIYIITVTMKFSSSAARALHPTFFSRHLDYN